MTCTADQLNKKVAIEITLDQAIDLHDLVRENWLKLTGPAGESHYGKNLRAIYVELKKVK